MSATKHKSPSISWIFATILILPMLLQSCNPKDMNSKNPPNGFPTIIVDASDLIDHLAREHTFMNNGRFDGAWLFNNTAIQLGERSTMQGSVNLQTSVNIPESGQYHLFVRAAGRPGSSLKIAIGDQMTEPVICDSIFTWQSAGSMDLNEGEQIVLLTRVNRAPAFDVLVITEDENFKGEIKEYQFQGEVELLKEYEVGRTNVAKFGDVDGDGKSDLFVLDSWYSATVYNHAGEQLWKYEAPEEGSRLRGQHEGPGVIWDLYQDGLAEVIHWRFLDGKECLVIADGMTGKVLKKVEWPCLESPHNYNNYRIAIGKLHPGYPDNIIVFTDPGNTKSVTAFSPDLEILWRHDEERKKDHLGHYPYPVDLDGDGIDEVVLSPFVLNAKGEMVWDRFDLFNDNHDHADSYRFADITGDGKPEMLAAMSDMGVVIFEALTGKILWSHVAEHSQQIESGNFLKALPGPQIAVNARYYGSRNAPQGRLTAEIHWFDKEGNYLSKWPANPISGNPDFVKGNWMGDGNEVLFWDRFRITEEGKGKMYFPETVYHMFDFTGNGADEVITRDYRSGFIKVYGAKHANPSGKPSEDPDILRHKVTNHTHY